MPRRALLIGIDDYPGHELTGCVADAVAMAGQLESHHDGSPNFGVKLVTDASRSCRADVREDIETLFAQAQHHDLFFYFSGHGRLTKYGAELVTADMDGFRMTDLLTLANSSPANSVTVILDCCYSGSVGNLEGLQATQVAEEFRKNITVLADGVAVLAASRPTEAAEESDGQGVFTRLLLDGLDGGATDHVGHVTALSLYTYAVKALSSWDPGPVFKAHLIDVPVLRKGPPWLDPALLRQLPATFKTRDARVTMSPAHEGEGRPLPTGTLGTAEQQQFDYLKRLRNAGLVTTDNGEDHYFVAMNRGDVYLTKSGRYLWDLADRKQL